MTDDEKLSQEQRVMRAMRKTLAHVIRETTPQPGMKHPLSDACIEDLRQCLALIAARERDIAEALGLEMNMRPKFAHQTDSSSPAVVSIASLKSSQKDKPH